MKLLKFIKFIIKTIFIAIILFLIALVLLLQFPKKTARIITDKFCPSVNYNFDNIFFSRNGVALDNLTIIYESMPGSTVKVNHISVLLNPRENNFANIDVNIDGGSFISDLNFEEESKKTVRNNQKPKHPKAKKNFKINVNITNFYVFAKKIKIENISGTSKVSRDEISAKFLGENFFNSKTTLIFKQKNKKISFEIDLSSLDAGEFCNMFDLKKNHLTGSFSGVLKSVIDDGNVESLVGKLYSDGTGKLFFSEAEKYVGTMDEGMNKQLIKIMVAQLKNYNYINCDVDFSYIPKEKSTVVVFDFDGEISNYKFPIYYHATWMDALEFISKINY